MTDVDLSEAFEKARQRERDDAIDAEVRKHYDTPLTKPIIEKDKLVFERDNNDAPYEAEHL